MEKIEMVPGLSNLVDQLSNDLNECKHIWFPAVPLLMDTFPRYLHRSGAVHRSEQPRS
jgi:hypothetical protein